MRMSMQMKVVFAQGIWENEYILESCSMESLKLSTLRKSCILVLLKMENGYIKKINDLKSV